LRLEHFDKVISKNKDFYSDVRDFVSPDPARKKERNAFFEFANIKSGARVLDFGCGTGSYTIPLLSKGCVVTAIDSSGVSLNILQEKSQRLNLSQNLERTIHGSLDDHIDEYKDYFDYVVFVDVLHHVADMKRTISHLQKVLKKGGYIIGMEPNGKFPLWRFYGLVTPTFVWKEEKGVRHCRVERFERIFKELNLEDFSYRYWSLVPGILANRMPLLFQLNDFLIQLRCVAQFSGFIMIKAKKADYGKETA